MKHRKQGKLSRSTVLCFIVGVLFLCGLIFCSLLIFNAFSFQGVLEDTTDTKSITTTIYTTLITVLLALLALAVTAYVFVAGFLKDQQKPYEKKSINVLLNAYTIFLIILAILSIVMLLGCFLLDNADDPVLILHRISPRLIIVMSVLAIFLLLVYTCCIIGHDWWLIRIARYTRKKIVSSRIKSELVPETDSVFKWIGDMEMLAEQLVKNHGDSFHAPDDQSVLISVTSREFAESYDKLRSYRDCLWVERCDSLSYSEYHTLRDDVRKLEDSLRSQFLEGERLQNQSFTAPFLSLSTAPLCLNGTVFTNRVFEKYPQKPEGIDFRKAELQGADFTHARLNCVDLRGANCREAVFSDAVLTRIQADADSCFERGVFQNTDFGGQRFATERGVMCFKSASFVNALLTNCSFTWCDLRQAAFHQAVMSSVKLECVCLSYADLSGAILTNARLSFQREKGSRFRWKEYWLPAQLDGKGRPLPAFTDFWERQRLGPAFFVNLENCVLSQACIENYNLVGSRMSNANFSDALLRHCILDRCYGQRATFQETVLENCRFAFAMFSLSDFSHAHIVDCDFSNCDLRDSLLVQTEVRRKGPKGPCFCKSNFTHAQVRGGRFINCDFTMALFEDADLRDTVFENCGFEHASFTDCRLQGAKFLRCDLEGVDLREQNPALFEITECTGTYITDKPLKNKQEME